jgi:hypothetical protein
MTHTKTTIERLQQLQELYRRGYHSDTVARFLEKLLSLERAAAERELVALQSRVAEFEQQYGMSSEEFYRRFRAGELGDSADFVEWSVFHEMCESVQERLQELAVEAA